MRLAFVVSAPCYYFSPLFLELADLCELQVFYLTMETVQPYHDVEFTSEFPPPDGMMHGYNYWPPLNSGPMTARRGFFSLKTNHVARKILEYKPDLVIIHGWQYLALILIAIRLKLGGVSVGFRSESVLRKDLESRSFIFLGLKKLILRTFTKVTCDFGVCLSRQSREFLEFYAPHLQQSERLAVAPYCVGFNFNKVERQGVPFLKDSPHINLAFVGKLTRKKNVETLINYVFNLGIRNLRLNVYGDGPLSDHLKELAINRRKSAPQDCPPEVIFHGFQPQDELEKKMADNHVLILPSTFGETWGVVINEALSCGLSVLVSDRVGSADFFQEVFATEACFAVYRFNDFDSFRRNLEFLIDSYSERDNSRIINVYSNTLHPKNVAKSLHEQLTGLIR